MIALSDRYDPPDSDLLLAKKELIIPRWQILDSLPGPDAADNLDEFTTERTQPSSEEWLKFSYEHGDISELRASVSIGKPRAEPLANVMGKNRSRRLETLMLRHDMHLVEFFCSFQSLKGKIKPERAEFNAKFRCDAGLDPPLVHDLDPREINTEIKVARKVTLDPTARFSEIELGVGSIDFAIEYTRLKPTVIGGGDGEDRVFWEYLTNRAQGLGGGKRMYAVIYAPKGASAGYVSCNLNATVKRKDRRFWQGLSEDEAPNLRDIRLW